MPVIEGFNNWQGVYQEVFIMPVWYVVGILEFNPVEGCAVWKLLGVHETNTAEVRSGSLYQLVWRYHEQGMYQVQGFMVAREVSNPFRDFQIGV